MRRGFLLLGAGLIAVALPMAACSGDNGSTPPPVGDGGLSDGFVPPVEDGGSDGGQDTEFTTFVKGLIVNETRDDNQPTPTENRTFTDKEDPNAFPPSFF